VTPTVRMISECPGMPIKEPSQDMTKKGKGKSDTNLVTAMVAAPANRVRSGVDGVAVVPARP